MKKIEITVDPATMSDVYTAIEAMEKAIEASWKLIHESQKRTEELEGEIS